jgi:hypothetical protein
MYGNAKKIFPYGTNTVRIQRNGTANAVAVKVLLTTAAKKKA